MTNQTILESKKVLVVDDEPDVLESIEEALEHCHVDTAADYESAEQKLRSKPYDIVVLDIMGVNGYELLAVANEQKVPAVMLTAHALSADNFTKSLDEGACAYLPKEKMFDIGMFLADVLSEGPKKCGMLGRWFEKLKDYYESKFGPGWLAEYRGARH
jgi:CheY-like chemotaxis protein